MGRAIIKLSPDEDRYIIWSSVVDSHIFEGTRLQTVDFLQREAANEARRNAIEALARADETGTSDQHFGTFAWDDAERHQVMEGGGPGYITRDRLAAFIDADSEEEAEALLDPMVYD